jgi:hypothetical protein
VTARWYAEYPKPLTVVGAHIGSEAAESDWAKENRRVARPWIWVRPHVKRVDAGAHRSATIDRPSSHEERSWDIARTRQVDRHLDVGRVAVPWLEDDLDRHLFRTSVAAVHEHERVLADEPRTGLPVEATARAIEGRANRQRPALVSDHQVAGVSATGRQLNLDAIQLGRDDLPHATQEGQHVERRIVFVPLACATIDPAGSGLTALR